MIRPKIKFFSIALSIALIVSCTSQPDHAETNSDKDTSQLIVEPEPLDSTLIQYPYSIKDIDVLEIETGIAELDSMIELLKSESQVVHIDPEEYCLGDCCERKQYYIDEVSSSWMHLFKHSCGEYGFGNDQYIFKNDELFMVRHFNQSISAWSTETTPTTFLLEEEFYLFEADRVIIKTRSQEDTVSWHYGFTRAVFKESVGDKSAILKEQILMMDQHKELEAFEAQVAAEEKEAEENQW